MAQNKLTVKKDPGFQSLNHVYINDIEIFPAEITITIAPRETVATCIFKYFEIEVDDIPFETMEMS